MFAFLLLELEHLKVELQRREEDEEEEKENRQVGEQRKLTLVEELKEEIQQLQDRKKREGRHQEEEKQKRVFAAVRREIERQEEKGAGLQVSHTSTLADRQPIKTGKNKDGRYLSCLCRVVEGLPFCQNRMSASHH